jgi:hypothetical protein
LSAAAGDVVGDDRRRARVVAAAARGLALAAGVDPPSGLRLWALAGTDVSPSAAPAGVDGSEVLGAALEAATDGGRRRVQGLHVTPRWLADDLVARAVPAPGAAVTVCDPACGGGAFLVAAAERLHRAGIGRPAVVRRHLWGADIDPVGLAAAEAALALWAGEAPPPGRLVVGDPLVAGAALWPDGPAGGFAAVVGNPPFQSQLGRATARSAAERGRLRARYGRAVRAYTDTAWLFLLLGCELVQAGGRVALVQPQSVVGARDAAAVRAEVDRRADLRGLWVDERRVFAASVRVCAPVLVRRDGPAALAAAAGDRWGALAATALGVPDLPDLGGPPLGERATVVAGFRDEYYGLVGAVREHDAADDPAAVGPLVTSGALGWATSTWGDSPVRFAKRAWRRPVVDLNRVTAAGPPAARRWIRRTRGPKLVVATQTRVVEAAVDAAGTWVPSVPALAVVPHDPADLWRLGAAVLAPAATAWLTRRAAGTGLDHRILRVAGPGLAALPLPAADAGAWEAAADHLRRLAGGEAGADDQADLDAYLAAAGAAYGVPGTVAAWWCAQRAGRAAEPVGHPATPAG